MVSRNDDRGMVLIVVLVTIALLAALGAALTVATTTEVAIAANYREATETLYAAEAGVAFVMQEVAAIGDWSGVAAGSGQSAFVDGSPAGTRVVGSSVVDLTDATDILNAIAPAGPGAVPPWVLHAFGPLQDLLPSSAVAPRRTWPSGSPTMPRPQTSRCAALCRSSDRRTGRGEVVAQ